MNKKIIKDMFDKKINSKEIHNYVIDVNSTKRKINTLKLIIPSIITMCITLLMFVSLTSNNNKLESSNIKESKDNKIYINDLEKNDNNRKTMAYDFELLGTLDKTSLENILPKFPMLNDIKTPKYTKISVDKHTWDQDNQKQTAYYLNYSNEYTEIESYWHIEIYFSRYVDEKPRCLRMYKEGLKESIINDISVMIYKSGVLYGDKHIDKYYALFTYEGVNFDIEVQNISEKEFIELIESIIQ